MLKELLTSSPKPCPKHCLPTTQWVCGLHGKNVIQRYKDSVTLQAWEL